MNKWDIIDTGASTAQWNMEFDQHLLDKMSLQLQEKPILHLYDWDKHSITYGYFIKPHELLRLHEVEELGLQFARRPTGGGITFHTTDLAFSMLVPAGHQAYSVNTLENYAFVNRIIISVIMLFTNNHVHPILLPNESATENPSAHHFCMAKPTKYDIMIHGQKVGGGAQRRTKYGFLHQGTISLLPPDEFFLEKILIHNAKIIEEMRSFSYALLGSQASDRQIAEARKEIKKLLAERVAEGVHERTCS